LTQSRAPEKAFDSLKTVSSDALKKSASSAESSLLTQSAFDGKSCKSKDLQFRHPSDFTGRLHSLQKLRIFLRTSWIAFRDLQLRDMSQLNRQSQHKESIIALSEELKKKHPVKLKSSLNVSLKNR